MPIFFQVFSGAVHPRVGGEHVMALRFTPFGIGSSPRGRGTRDGVFNPDGSPRFIPAWAGNTLIDAGASDDLAVHPRVGGEHCTASRSRYRPTGSSPRGRGTLLPGRLAEGPVRFIPAWAGNTSRPDALLLLVPVHPRVGGEHQRMRCLHCRISGSSPRGRGTRSDRAHE